MPDWQIRVRDRNREQVATLGDFTKATFVQRFNGVGAWIISGVPVGSDAATALVPGAGIIVLRDGAQIMSGPLLFPVFNWDKSGNTLDVSGASDEIALAARLCYPAAPSLDLNAAYSDDRSGNAETVMRGYVDANAGPTADTSRQWAGLTLDPDGGQGSAVSYTARLDVLSDVLSQLALVGGGLGFRIVQDDDSSDLRFQVYQPSDRSASARFSPSNGNMTRSTYGDKAATVNASIVGGSGDGTARVFIVREDPTSMVRWNMRLEGFKDQRQTADVDELIQAGDEELSDHGDQVNLDMDAIDSAAVAYGTAYGLGDTVSVQVSDATVVDTIRSIQFDLAADGERITPQVGTPGAVEAGTSEAQALDLMLQRVTDLATRLSRLSTAT